MNPKTRIVSSVFFLLLALWALTSCKKDLDLNKVKDLDWNPDFAIALVSDSITFERALIETGTEKNFFIDETGNVSILYYFRNDAFKIHPGDLLLLPPCSTSFSHQVTSLEQQVIASSDLALPPVTYPVNLIGNNPNARIDNLLVREGTLLITADNTFSNSGYLVVRIVNATRNGVPFSVTIDPFREGNSETLVDLSGVLFDMTASPNTATLQIEGVIKKSDRPVAGDVFALSCRFIIPKIGWFKGYVGQQTLTQPQDTVRVTVFNNAYALGTIYFVDPQASITVINSIGVPSLITVESLKAINDVSGVMLDIGDRLGSGAQFVVPSPEISSLKPVTKVQTYTDANTGNSMNELFNLKPDRVVFKIRTEVNHDGPCINFFSDTSSFYADLNVILPLYGHFDHLTKQDTFDFKLPMQDDIEQVQFKLDMVNGLPLSAMVQVYFTDLDFHLLDSLAAYKYIAIREVPVDPFTHLPLPGVMVKQDTSFFFDHQRMENLKAAKKILVRGVMNSSEGGTQDVKIKAMQMLIVNMAARVKLHKYIDPVK